MIEERIFYYIYGASQMSLSNGEALSKELLNEVIKPAASDCSNYTDLKHLKKI